MRLALAQIDTTVGDFDHNVDAILKAAREARTRGARLVLTPELSVCGYPPRDFLEMPAFHEAAERAVERLVREAPPEVAILAGTIEPHEGPGGAVYNGAVLIREGRIVARARKCLLPTYDVFDEARWFEPATEPLLVELDGVRIGVTICEDLWNDEAFWPRRRYTVDPVSVLAQRGAQLLVNLSASPFAIGKARLRRELVQAAVRRHGLPLALVNLVGGNDALVFDGHSLVMDAAGDVVAQGSGFREELLVVDLEPAAPSVRTPGEAVAPSPTRRPAAGEATVLFTPLAHEISDQELDDLFEALVLGTRDYAQKTGFRSAVLGLSGGADSALVAVVAAAAFGGENVHTVSLPSRYTADISNEDAFRLAANLGTKHQLLPIEKPFQALLEVLAESFDGRPPGLAEENLQARTRGALLMGLSNKFNHLLLNTGNKSELGVGYCTLYGDMAGGLSVIGDVPKTLVYALCHRLNSRHGGVLIPLRILERPPSAELRENQTDQDSLPPYEQLDRILRRHVEAREDAEEIALHEADIPRPVIDRVMRLIRVSEYKRRQAPPVLRMTPRAFGDGWRFPIAQRSPV